MMRSSRVPSVSSARRKPAVNDRRSDPYQSATRSDIDERRARIRDEDEDGDVQVEKTVVDGARRLLRGRVVHEWRLGVPGLAREGPRGGLLDRLLRGLRG